MNLTPPTSNIFGCTPEFLLEKLGLTQREKEVLAYLAHGFSAKRSAEPLKIDYRTIEKHRERINKKMCHTLGLSGINVALATRIAVFAGLVPHTLPTDAQLILAGLMSPPGK